MACRNKIRSVIVSAKNVSGRKFSNDSRIFFFSSSVSMLHVFRCSVLLFRVCFQVDLNDDPANGK